MPPDIALGALAAACDGHARGADDTDAVAGVLPRYVACPASTEQASQVLRLAAEHGLCVVARGAATTLDWGVPPRAVDLVVDTTGLAGVVEHAAGDLVVVVRAGTTYESLQETLAEAHQQLALDVPLPGPTLGGIVATDTSGPRRLLYGTVRDLLIGITFVRADGVVAKAGGKVVKNVAGYDFGKLLTGSHGTLGLITQVAFRLHPLPAATRFVTVPVSGPVEAARAVAAVVGSQVVPSAVEVDQPDDGPSTVAVLLEGTEPGVEGRASATASLLGVGSVGGEAPAWWGSHPFSPGEVGLKLTTQVSGVGRLLAAVRQAARRHGVAISVRGSAVGAFHAGLPDHVSPGTAAAVVADLRAAAASYGGRVVVVTAPPAVRGALDMWGPVSGLDLMRRLKHELDPAGRLSPGRFVGGI